MENNSDYNFEENIENRPVIQETSSEINFKDFIRSFWTNKVAHQWVIFLFAFLLYSNSIGNKYAIDDLMVIQDNDFTRKGVSGFYGIFFYDTFYGFFGNQKNIVSGGRYRPLTVASFALENQLFGKVIKNYKTTSIIISYVKVEASKKEALIQKLGNPKYSIKESKKEILDGQEKEILTLNIEIAPGNFIPDRDGDIMYEGNPHISHAINALLYALLCLLLYLWIYKMFDPSESGTSKAMFIAFVASLLYAAHPLHTEAVANIKGRDEIAVTLLSVLAAYWTMKSINTEKWIIYLSAAVIAFIMALFSKESAIPFLAVIPATIYFFQKDVKPKVIVLRTLPFVAIVLVFWFAIRNPILKLDPNAPEPMDLMNNPFLKVDNTAENPKCIKFSKSEKNAMVLHTWFDYLKLLAIPYPLTSDYYPKHIGVSEHETKPTEGINITELRDDTGKVRYIKDNLPTFSSPVVLISILLHLLMAIFAFWGIRKKNPISFALIFYAATFSVVSNILFPIGTLLAERFMFMPSIGFSLICAILLSLLTFDKDGNFNKIGKNFSVSILLILTICYSYITFYRNFDWYDNTALFINDINVSVNSAKMNNDYANAMIGSSQQSTDLPLEQRKELAKKGIYYSANSINIYPLFSNAWVHHGNAYVTLGNLIQIEADSLRKISSPEAKNYYNEVLKLYNHSLTVYQKAQKYSPDSTTIYGNLAIIYRTRGNLFASLERNKEAISDFEQANKFTYGRDVEINRLLAAAYGVAAINNLKDKNLTDSENNFNKCMEALDRGIKIMPIHMLSTIINLKNANIALAKEEYASICNKRADIFNNIILSIDPNYKENQ